MKVLKATQEQYNSLNGFKKGNSILNFTKDANGNWIVGKNVLTGNNFIEVREQLQQLEEIEHEPLITDIL